MSGSPRARAERHEIEEELVKQLSEVRPERAELAVGCGLGSV
ncbi:hypothetical protein [Streptomyces sp. NBC_01022]|nr:hypothetical protein [Streptomyces sp. NBC_01022]WRZ78853.1 hypothetical protein OG316_00520 [Streptomyces sp. NBC_01022]WRZ86826.1 hypothetical protein OG316_44375 [Streptomyces sp. NBC_01022]